MPAVLADAATAPAALGAAPRTRYRPILFPGIGAIAGLLVLGALLIVRSTGASSKQAPAASPAPPATGATLFNGTFDSLAVNRPLPAPWSMTGAGSATIVALPSAHDLSVRLRSDTRGTPVTACRPIADVLVGGALRLDLDLRPESLPTTGAMPVVSLDAAGSPVVALALDPKGRITDSASGVVLAKLRTQAWYHVSLTVDRSAGTYDWQASTVGASPAPPRAPAALRPGSGPMDAICLASPGGVPGGSLVVNNLVVRE